MELLREPLTISPPSVRVSPQEIDLWKLPLGAEAVECQSLLDEEEIHRSRRYVFPEDRNRFIRGRASLKLITSAYLGISPSEVVLLFDDFGKPFIKDSPIHFNLAHSGEIGLLAISSAPVGVDVEVPRANKDLREIAERFFAANEREVLGKVDDSELEFAFLRIWTRKEAYVKGIGKGLSLGLDRFDVSMGWERDHVACLVYGDQWWVSSFSGLGWSGALASSFVPRRLRWREFDCEVEINPAECTDEVVSVESISENGG